MEILVAKARRGDEDAFFELIEHYKLSMYKAAKSILNNEEDIADAIQETIISAYKNIKKLKNNSYFKTWITRILINKCKDIIHKNKGYLLIDNYNEESYIQDFLTKFELEEALGDLSKEQKLVISLYYISEFNIREISEILNESQGTVKSRLFRARNKLKSRYRSIEEV